MFGIIILSNTSSDDLFITDTVMTNCIFTKNFKPFIPEQIQNSCYIQRLHLHDSTFVFLIVFMASREDQIGGSLY